MGTEAAARPERPERPPAPAPGTTGRSGRAAPRNGARSRLALVAILLVGASYAAVIQNWSDNQSSHYDLIRALDAGRTTIDPGPYPTKDKAFYESSAEKRRYQRELALARRSGRRPKPAGHWFSARAPGLAIFSLPFYKVISAVDAPALARSSKALRGEDEMIYFVGLWGSVLPGLLLALLVWRVADRFEPGYGVAAAVALGLGTMVLPFSTMLFSHVFAALLAFAAFALMVHERDGPPRPWLVGLAGLAVGYGVASEYPVLFAGVVLGVYLLARRDAWTPRVALARAAAYIGGGVVGIVPLLLYNHAAFGSWTHLAYSNIPQQKKGFFGIDAPSLKVLGTLLFDSRGLLTLAPVLIMGGVGTWLLYRRGRRAEALVTVAVCVCYLGYNSGYYLPFGGGAPGPRFLITVLPFLAFPIALACRRYPGPTLALAAVSITTTLIATITHPLVGYETETVIWTRLLSHGSFQPTIASAFGAGRGWGAIWPVLLLVGSAIVVAMRALPRLELSARGAGAAVLALLAWGVFAALAPTALGIDHRGLESILGAGDVNALHKGFGDYPLRTLAPLAAGVGLLALAAAWLTARTSARGPDGARPRSQPQISGG